MKTGSHDPVIATRCPKPLYTAFLKLARDQERTPSQLLRWAIQHYLQSTNGQRSRHGKR